MSAKYMIYNKYNLNGIINPVNRFSQTRTYYTDNITSDENGLRYNPIQKTDISQHFHLFADDNHITFNTDDVNVPIKKTINYLLFNEYSDFNDKITGTYLFFKGTNSNSVLQHSLSENVDLVRYS